MRLKEVVSGLPHNYVEDNYVPYTGADKAVDLGAHNLTVGGHGAFGGDASIDATKILNLNEDVSFADVYNSLVDLISIWTPTGLFAANTGLYGLTIQTTYDDEGAGHNQALGRLYPFRSDSIIAGTTTGNFDRVSAYRGGSYHYGTGTVSQMEGIYATLHNDDGEGNETGDITDAYGMRVEFYNDKNIGAFVNAYGIDVQRPLGGGTYTNFYGIRIGNLNQVGVGTSRGLYFIGTGVENDINWGDRTNLYESAAGVLKTDNKLQVALELEVDGNFNHDGSNVGFYGTAPIAQAVLATGGGATVDDVISALQSLGLVKQA